ncbi:alpha-amylase family glycosyl hydrolase [Geotoga petraea]|uniref:Alpha-amylase n=1 Tax=Geotoga petraea TaxID=28234 RepID=A0A4Z0W0P8_9BACT|nr:alpha-amylase family glycosyl hydrolase [Geotoga petraea]TGG87618.1 alpha-amylase [Geotoga petraea]
MKKLSFILLLFLMTLITFSTTVTFIFDAKEAEEVYLIGDFLENGKQKMDKSFTGLWRLKVNLEEGKYLYKYEIDGEEKINYSNTQIDFKNGEVYNYRIVKGMYFESVGDGIVKEAIHETSREYINPVKPGEIYLSLKVRNNDVEDVVLEGNFLSSKKQVINNDDMLEYRFHVLTDASLLKYRFRIIDGQEIIIGYNNTEAPFEFDFNNPKIAFFNVPDWAKGRVFYQIFTDRFRNGNKENDPIYTPNWYGDHTKDKLMFNHYGGDLDGVIQSEDYFKELGIQGIYFNPIFESISTHKYNTTDYLSIDHRFGTEKTFENLVDMLHSNNVKIILDGVFNHTGTEFFAMQENFEKQKESNYLDWYYIKQFPIEEKPTSYESWQGYASLPELNIDNPEVKAFFNRVIGKWMMKNIDGWRLDAADQVPKYFWNNYFYPNVKSINEEAFVVGEYWKDSTEYFQAPSFDGVMNYLFKDAALLYVKNGQAKTFVDSTNRYLNKYPPQVVHSLWNLLGSHDTERIFTMLDEDVERMKMISALQMTFVGAPLIYYGDEIGMTGGNDPFDRKPFPWKKEMWNEEIFNHYKKMIELRKIRESLQIGDYKVLEAEDGLLIFERSTQKETTTVVINSKNSPIKTNILNGEFKDLYNDDIIEGVTEVPAKSFMILEKK